jgi:hypothetical protein
MGVADFDMRLSPACYDADTVPVLCENNFHCSFGIHLHGQLSMKP